MNAQAYRNHCGLVLAHRGCPRGGRVEGTIIYCSASQQEFETCEYHDPQKLSWQNPNRIMLPSGKTKKDMP